MKKIITAYDWQCPKEVNIENFIHDVDVYSLRHNIRLAEALCARFGLKKLFLGISLQDVYEFCVDQNCELDWLKRTYKIREREVYCCNDYEKYLAVNRGFLYLKQGLPGGTLVPITYCPFCGVSLKDED